MPVWRFRAHAASVIALLPVVGLLAAVRLREMHSALLYPDGYQYLLMAKGIAAHGRPFLRLGPNGDTLLPSADAAMKPVFPAAVAAVHLLGLSWTQAARAVTAVAGAAAIVLTGLLAGRLGGSRLAAVVAAGLCLASPEFRFWTGFAGPEPLALALATAAVLVLHARRPVLGGVLVALAVLTRPEFLLPAAAAAVAGFVLPQARKKTAEAAMSAALTTGAVLVAFRPSLVLPPVAAFASLAAAPLAATAFFALRRRRPTASVALVAAVFAAAVAIVVAGRAPGLRVWLAADWPLFAAAAAGAIVCAWTPFRRASADAVVLAAVLLLAAYWTKNPASDRYVALLTPLLALLCGLGVSALRSSAYRALAAVLAALVLWEGATAGAGRAAPASDQFAAVAAEIAARRLPDRPFVTVAPDAYGVLLLGRSVRLPRPGASGLILLDGAQRAYAPGMRVRGRLLARLSPGPGFERPDGTVDDRPVLVILGRVLATG
jgi:hypothetical protein